MQNKYIIILFLLCILLHVVLIIIWGVGWGGIIMHIITLYKLLPWISTEDDHCHTCAASSTAATLPAKVFSFHIHSSQATPFSHLCFTSTWDSRVWLAWRWPLPFRFPLQTGSTWICPRSWRGVNGRERLAVCSVVSVWGPISEDPQGRVIKKESIITEYLWSALKKSTYYQFSWFWCM